MLPWFIVWVNLEHALADALGVSQYSAGEFVSNKQMAASLVAGGSAREHRVSHVL